MKQAKDYLIFPLDLPTVEEALHYVRILSRHVGIFKVGLELFVKIGPDIIRRIKSVSPEAGIFLDLKLHDIPATVKRAMVGIAGLGVTFATVHCGDSRNMLSAAVEGASGKVKLLGVTVLTSVAAGDIQQAGYSEAYAGDVGALVLKKTGMAKDAGFSGVICSGHEAGVIKKQFGREFLAVTPGIRLSAQSENKDDQKRVLTPTRAIRNGSDHLVIGRPIRDAQDPARTAMRIVAEIETSLTHFVGLSR